MTVISLAERMQEPPDSADHIRLRWASRISARWQDSVDAILDVGRLLIEAKGELPHGQWLKMFDGREVPFGKRTAQMLIKVSLDARLTNTKHASLLPNSWFTLYELTKLDDETWGMALESGAIHPEMERKDVNLLRNEASRNSRIDAASPSAPSDLTCSVTDLQALIDRGLKFGAIYADPPWLYGNQGTRAATGNHYGGMTVDEIAAMPVARLAADNAHLHLWTTNAFLFDCKSIMEAWGFEYKSCLVWVKPQMGIGNYWRVSHEFMLLGVRGSCPFLDRSQMSWIQEPRTKHSAKPEAVRKMVESVSPGPYLELFGRRIAPGWVVWGDQIKRTMFESDVEAL